MRRSFLLGLAGLVVAPAATFGQGAGAQGAGQPPHAWLFGTWTGGIFPPLAGLSSEACFSQPVVVFTRDLVMRATLTEQTLTQRVVETVRASDQGWVFRLVSTGSPLLAGGGAAGSVGFGCQSPDVLTVQRRGDNEIAFPDCSDFPYPLVRCSTAQGGGRAPEAAGRAAAARRRR